MEADKGDFYVIRHEYGEAGAKQILSLASSGDSDSQLMLADCYADAAEHKTAFYWYKRAASGGNAEAYYKLSFYYEGKYIGIGADDNKARECLRTAIEKGYSKAVTRLGDKFYSGEGIEKNLDKAFKCYHKAARMGDDEGKANVGLCYMKGEGVTRDETKAFEWLSRSSDPKWGYYNLAQCYITGIGTKINVEKGVKYLELAVQGKCLNLYSAKEELKRLYQLGYGGKDAHIKLIALQNEIDRDDKLVKGIVDLYYNEMESNSNQAENKTDTSKVIYLLTLLGHIFIGAVLSYLAYPYLVLITVPFTVVMQLIFPESKLAAFIVKRNLFWADKSHIREDLYISSKQEKRALLSLALLALNMKVAALVALAIIQLGVAILTFCILLACGFFFEGSASGITGGTAYNISKIAFRILTPIVTPAETALTHIFQYIGRREFKAMGLEFPELSM